MISITSVQLRNQLDDFFRRASKGEKIRVTYRGKASVILGPDENSRQSNTADILAKAQKISQQLPQNIKQIYSSDEAVQKAIDKHRQEKYSA